ncbi:MAG: prepilin-type N-terminal cleavage/methylation domain-containing protein [Thermodesulfobacteriota bacterium]|nr:prepilin-type N-terminal cleavage/methylation domain-containing protein [Thermodesulfobacteriota bacterium]
MKREKGFTLLEVLIALAIFSISLLGLASLSVYTVKGNASSKRISSATVLAESQVEAFQNMAFNNANLNPGTRSDPNNPVDEDGNSGGMYTRTWTVTDNTPFSGIKKVAVTVSWDSGNHSVTLNTLIAR